MKNPMRLSVFLLLCFFVMSCNKSDDDLCELNPSTDVACFEIYDPVCGCNEVTYGNECLANAAGVPLFTPGECP